MALADRHSNSIQSNPGVAAGVDFYRMDSTQQFAVGHRIQRADGNVFVYAHFLTDSAQGTVVGPDVSEGGEVAGVDNAVIAPASAAEYNNEQPGAIGSKSIQMTNAGIVADEHAGGYLVIVSGTGNGYTYRIKGNTATGAPASGEVRIDLHDKLVVALDATSDVHIMGSKYAQLIKATGAGGEDNLAVGVTMGNMDVSEAAYGWILTKGIGGALVDGTIAAGEAVTLSDGVAGALQVAAGGTTAVADLIDERVVGQCIIPDASTGLATFQLNFD